MVAGWKTSTTPGCSKLVGSRDQGASPMGTSVLLLLHGQSCEVPLAVASLAAPAQSGCVASHVSAFPLTRFYFSLSPVKLRLAVTFLQQLKKNPPLPASVGSPSLH